MFIWCHPRTTDADKTHAADTNVMAAAEKAFAQVGVTGWIMCHLSHSYYSGVCLYFTFGFRHNGVDPLGQYERVKNAVQQAFVDSGGTLSHHHAVRRLARGGHLCARHSDDRRPPDLDGAGTQLQPRKVIAK